MLLALAVAASAALSAAVAALFSAAFCLRRFSRMRKELPNPPLLPLPPPPSSLGGATSSGGWIAVAVAAVRLAVAVVAVDVAGVADGMASSAATVDVAGMADGMASSAAKCSNACVAFVSGKYTPHAPRPTPHAPCPDPPHPCLLSCASGVVQPARQPPKRHCTALCATKGRIRPPVHVPAPVPWPVPVPPTPYDHTPVSTRRGLSTLNAVWQLQRKHNNPNQMPKTMPYASTHVTHQRLQSPRQSPPPSCRNRSVSHRRRPCPC